MRGLRATTRDSMGRKWCSACSEWLQENAFGPDRRRNDGLNNHCRACMARYMARRRAAETMVCAYPGCPNAMRNRRLCDGHYAQRRRGEQLRPLLVRRDLTIRDSNGHRQCSGCEGWLPEGDFYGDKTHSDGLSSECRQCISRHKRIRLYGCDTEDLFAAQGGECAICADPLGASFHVDHDHNCCPGRTSCGSCVRGLLCNGCNNGLGRFRDSPDILDAAAGYLRKWQLL